MKIWQRQRLLLWGKIFAVSIFLWVSMVGGIHMIGDLIGRGNLSHAMKIVDTTASLAWIIFCVFASFLIKNSNQPVE